MSSSTTNNNRLKTRQVSRKEKLIAKVHFRDAFKLLLSVESSSSHPDSVRAELPAIISHWLQSPKFDPLVLGSEAGLRWTKILATHALADSRLSAEPPNLSGTPILDIDFSGLSYPPVQNPKFSFIDLFAGIGGFRIALQELEGKCLFSSEWDKHAKETYLDNFGEVPFGDIKNFTAATEPPPLFQNSIPPHDILAGGFPCQAFSQAGRQMGFNEARGTLFFEVLKIAKLLRPRALILENVKRLKTHDHGRTFAVITHSLREIGYKVYAKVLRAYDFGLPQNRERIFIVAFEQPLHFEFPMPSGKRIYNTLGETLEPSTDDWYTISDRIYEGHKRRLREHRERGNGFGFSLFKRDALYVNTISARYWKDGSEVLVEQQGKNPRMLTPRECARLQGFPDSFKYHESRRQAYQQFGNSVPVPVVKQVAASVLGWLSENQKADFVDDPYEPIIQ
jgi:DNA (cytosine-5)-methyltransferase 1